LLPRDALAYRLVDGVLRPDYLDRGDHVWVDEVLEVVAGCEGSARHELKRRLREPLTTPAPPQKLRMVQHTVGQWAKAVKVPLPVAPRELRRTLFHAATDSPPEAARAEAAAAHGVAVSELGTLLFADLPDERPIGLPEGLPPTEELVLRTNLALAQGLLKRATELRVRLQGNARDIVRFSQLRGLICVPRAVDAGVELHISGPFSLFRRTTLYGRAQSQLLPRLPWCRDFHLTAECTLPEGPARLLVHPRTPIFSSAPPRRFDSKLEQRFAADLAKHHPDWQLLREPDVLQAGDHLVFPDFALQRRDQPSTRWLVELVGFWTPTYLRDKLDRLRRAGRRDLVLCVDETLGCDEAELPPDLPVVWFRRRVDPAEVIRRITPRGSSGPP